MASYEGLRGIPRFRYALFGLVLVISVAACADTWTFDGACDELPGPSAIVGFDPTTGEKSWDRTLADADGIVFTGNTIATIGPSGAAMGIDTLTGALLWCADLGAVPKAGTIVQPVFVSAGGTVATMTAAGDAVGINPDTGEELWRRPIGMTEGARLFGNGDSYWVLDGGANEQILEELDASTGQPIEAQPIDATTEPAQDVDDTEPDFAVRSFDSNRVTESGKQLIRLQVFENDEPVWDEIVPGFVAEWIGDTIIVIDQTAGTGDVSGRPATRVTAYEDTDGKLRWQEILPGTPHLVAAVAELVLIPVGSTIYAIDVATGSFEWDRDFGSAGKGGSYSETGEFRLIEHVGERNAIGLIRAEKPDTD